jgi:hypothetical protein
MGSAKKDRSTQTFGGRMRSHKSDSFLRLLLAFSHYDYHIVFTSKTSSNKLYVRLIENWRKRRNVSLWALGLRKRLAGSSHIVLLLSYSWYKTSSRTQSKSMVVSFPKATEWLAMFEWSSNRFFQTCQQKSLKLAVGCCYVHPVLQKECWLHMYPYVHLHIRQRREHAEQDPIHDQVCCMQSTRKSIWLPVRDVGVLSKGNKLKSATSVRMKWVIERCWHVTCISITFTQGYYDMRSSLNLESKNMSSNPAARNNMIPKPRNDQIKTLKQHVHYRWEADRNQWH